MTGYFTDMAVQIYCAALADSSLQVTGILSRFLFDSGEQRLHSDIFLALKIKRQFTVRKSILHGRDLGSTELILI